MDRLKFHFIIRSFFREYDKHAINAGRCCVSALSEWMNERQGHGLTKTLNFLKCINVSSKLSVYSALFCDAMVAVNLIEFAEEMTQFVIHFKVSENRIFSFKKWARMQAIWFLFHTSKRMKTNRIEFSQTTIDFVLTMFYYGFWMTKYCRWTFSRRQTFEWVFSYIVLLIPYGKYPLPAKSRLKLSHMAPEWGYDKFEKKTYSSRKVSDLTIKQQSEVLLNDDGKRSYRFYQWKQTNIWFCDF